MALRKRGSGRRSLLETDKKLSERYCKSVESGMSYVSAAMKEGISAETISGWKSKGERDLEEDTETIYTRFVQDLRAAEARSIGALEQKYHQLAVGKVKSETITEVVDAQGRVSTTTATTLKDSPNAVGWLLERRMKEVYGAKQEIEHSGDVGGKVIILDPGKEKPNE